jgi:hypothetical protein
MGGPAARPGSITGNVLGRGAIDVSGLYCAPCLARGHNCYAQLSIDGEPSCVFCEDGVPCLHDQKSDRVPLPAAAPAKRRRAPKNPSEVLPMQTQVKTNGHAPAPPPPRLCKCGCGENVPADNRFSYISGHMKHLRNNGKGKRSAKVGESGCSECGKKLRKDNRSGICTSCQKGTRAPAKAELAHNQAIAKSSPFVVEVPPAPPPALPGRLPLLVSEAQLDRYLLKLEFDWHLVVPKLPAELKLALVNAVLLAESETA